MPTTKENTSIFMGLSTGSNHRAGRVMSGRPKKVVAMTFTESPKKEPKRKPQKVVEMPQ